ncbi:MAG: ribosome small subunit-dependent GTPase A [Clostridia bacterium]|nr:ribosome small subunit-dependent GTPase A [Clostridia bacterium]
MADNRNAPGGEGRVLSIRRGIYEVETPQGILKCRAATSMRKKEGRILAGDVVNYTENGIEGGFITALCQRRNSFVRPPAANVDLLVITVSPREPEPYLYNVDLMSVIAAKCGVECLLIITKADLGGAAEIAAIYEKTPVKAIITSAATGEGISSARDALKGKVCLLCGASGVGKSSLLNAMYPQFRAETGELSEKIMRGRNTTRVTELHPAGDGTYIADSPGFTAVDTELYCEIDHKELQYLFGEFAQYAGGCRYLDCTHTKETECGVARAAAEGYISPSRLESYKKLYTELKNIDRYK